MQAAFFNRIASLSSECRDTLDGTGDSRTGKHLVVPTLDVGRLRQLHFRELAAPQPAEMRDVGDREVVTGSIGRVRPGCRPALLACGQPRCETGRSRTDLLRRLSLEKPGLSESGPNAGALKQDLLEDTVAARTVRRQELASLLRQINQDCTGLGQHKTACRLCPQNRPGPELWNSD